MPSLKRILPPHRSLLLVLISTFLTTFVDISLYVVIIILVQNVTGNLSDSAFILLFFVVPSLLTPFAGKYIDRLSKKSMLVSSNLAMGLSMILLACHNQTFSSFISIAIASLVFGFSFVIYNASRVALLVWEYEPEKLGKINSIFRTLREFLKLIAPAIAAPLFLFIGHEFFFTLSSLILLASSGLCSLLPQGRVFDQHEDPSNDASSWKQALWGSKLLLSNLSLKICIIGLSAVLLVSGFYELIIFSIIKKLDLSNSYFGLVVSLQGLGAICGGWISYYVINKVDASKMIVFSFLIQLIGVCILLNPKASYLLAAGGLFGFGAPLSMIALDTLIQTKLPAYAQGRINTAFEAITSIPFSLSFLVAGVLLYSLSYTWLILIMLVVMLLVIVVMTFFLGFKDKFVQHNSAV